MLIYKTGDILRDEAEAIVNAVNCVGVMGRGIALQFKKAYPENLKAYEAACKRNEVQPGKMFVYHNAGLLRPQYIINFPTKRHWRGKSRMEDVEAGLEALAEVIRENDIKSIAIPPLGCGLGGLEWSEVKARIEPALMPLANITITVYEPKGAPVSENAWRTEVPRMTASRAALVELIHRYLDGLLDPIVTLLEVHKLMYFMQVAGEKLRLQYQKGPYGPYAENLRHVLREIEGYFVSGYADGGDAPGKQLKLVPGAIKDASRFLENHHSTRAHFDRVTKLVEGFESPFGLELLSTVHWVVTNEDAHSIEEIIEHTYAWNPRKRQFTEHQIRLAADVLAKQGWTDTRGDS